MNKSIRLNATYIESLANHPITIRSQSPVQIMVIFGKTQRTLSSSYLALPVARDKYILASYQNFISFSSFFMLAAGDDFVTVTAYNHNHMGEPQTLWNKTLLPHEVTMMTTANLSVPLTDITGVFVNATGPVSVYSGHQCAKVPSESRSCALLFQQVPPQSRLGSEYIIGPVLGRSKTATKRIRLIASQGKTNISISISEKIAFENLLTSLHDKCLLVNKDEHLTYEIVCQDGMNPGDFVELNVLSTSTVLVVCQKCMAMFYNTGHDVSDILKSTAFMSLVTPVNKPVMDPLTFSTLRGFISGDIPHYTHFVDVIISEGSHVEALHLAFSEPDSMIPTELNVSEWVRSSSSISSYTVLGLQLPGAGHYQIWSSSPDGILSAFIYGHLTNASSLAAYGLPVIFQGNGTQSLAPRPEPPSTTPSEIPGSGDTGVIKNPTTVFIAAGAAALLLVIIIIVTVAVLSKRHRKCRRKCKPHSRPSPLPLPHPQLMNNMSSKRSRSQSESRADQIRISAPWEDRVSTSQEHDNPVFQPTAIEVITPCNSNTATESPSERPYEKPPVTSTGKINRIYQPIIPNHIVYENTMSTWPKTPADHKRTMSDESSGYCHIPDDRTPEERGRPNPPPRPFFTLPSVERRPDGELTVPKPTNEYLTMTVSP